MPNVLKVYLENGQTKAFKFEANTTVKVLKINRNLFVIGKLLSGPPDSLPSVCLDGLMPTAASMLITRYALYYILWLYNHPIRWFGGPLRSICLCYFLPGRDSGLRAAKWLVQGHYMSYAFILNHRLPNILSLPPSATQNRIN